MERFKAAGAAWFSPKADHIRDTMVICLSVIIIVLSLIALGGVIEFGLMEYFWQSVATLAIGSLLLGVFGGERLRQWLRRRSRSRP